MLVLHGEEEAALSNYLSAVTSQVAVHCVPLLLKSAGHQLPLLFWEWESRKGLPTDVARHNLAPRQPWKEKFKV